MAPFESPQKISPPLWMLAALGAVALHLSCLALALAYLRGDDFAAVGAPAVEIGIELVAPRLDPIELPPGPDVEPAIASPRVVEQRAVIEPAVLPQATPIETEIPERVVVLVETDKLKRELSEVPTPPAIQSVASVATQATAPPTSEAIPVSTRSVTPVQGTGESPERVRATWEKDLIAHFDRHKRYPANRSLQGARILVGFVLDEMGHVLSSSIVQGSGDATFDGAALAMIERANPVPKPPLLVSQQGLSFTLPVIFRAKRTN